VDVEKFSFNEPIVDISLQLTNENSFSLTLKDLHLYMNFEDLFRAEIHHPKEIRILANDITIINVTANVYELKALKTVWQLMVKRNEIDYNMRVKAKYIDETGEAEPINITVTNSGSVQTKSKKTKREEAGLTKKDVREARREERREERQAD
jgi:LEA14-like dessication related protein